MTFSKGDNHSQQHYAYAQQQQQQQGQQVPGQTQQGNSAIACANQPTQKEGQIPPFCGQLTVVKQVQGGTASPSQFIIHVTGNNPSQSTFPGSSFGTVVILGQDSYHVTESPVSDYTPRYSQGCSGSISAGQTSTCIITNAPAADTQLPQVLSFVVEPTTISLSGGGTITITAYVTDATGVQRVGVFIEDECGESPGFFQTATLSLVSGTPQDGIYQARFTFPQTALNVSHGCNTNLAFLVGGLAVDTLGNQVGLPVRGVILQP